MSIDSNGLIPTHPNKPLGSTDNLKGLFQTLFFLGKKKLLNILL
jgi:hypothetical protein